MPFGIDNKVQEVVSPAIIIDTHRQHIIQYISLNDMDIEEGVHEIQENIDAMSAKGFKPLTTSIDEDNQLYYIIYERREM
jgi:hypothetical protein